MNEEKNWHERQILEHFKKSNRDQEIRELMHQYIQTGNLPLSTILEEENERALYKAVSKGKPIGTTLIGEYIDGDLKRRPFNWTVGIDPYKPEIKNYKLLLTI